MYLEEIYRLGIVDDSFTQDNVNVKKLLHLGKVLKEFFLLRCRSGLPKPDMKCVSRIHNLPKSLKTLVTSDLDIFNDESLWSLSEKLEPPLSTSSNSQSHSSCLFSLSTYSVSLNKFRNTIDFSSMKNHNSDQHSEPRENIYNSCNKSHDSLNLNTESIGGGSDVIFDGPVEVCKKEMRQEGIVLWCLPTSYLCCFIGLRRPLVTLTELVTIMLNWPNCFSFTNHIAITCIFYTYHKVTSVVEWLRSIVNVLKTSNTVGLSSSFKFFQFWIDNHWDDLNNNYNVVLAHLKDLQGWINCKFPKKKKKKKKKSTLR
eukprot:TRINITY_DN8937_c0_g1_i2.p1 TRINITY_DN8937_c0_g1~~TRINITY_DN8937_c0_g1_i2.p1  ORF type:complete len:314 (+),score=48.31 TRINITY_DN8937_c0_g1_i2:466-1407(+)